MPITNWSSVVYSSDLPRRQNAVEVIEDGDQALGTRDFATSHAAHADQRREAIVEREAIEAALIVVGPPSLDHRHQAVFDAEIARAGPTVEVGADGARYAVEHFLAVAGDFRLDTIVHAGEPRSEEHTSELQSLMRISYAVFC